MDKSSGPHCSLNIRRFFMGAAQECIWRELLLSPCPLPSPASLPRSLLPSPQYLLLPAACPSHACVPAASALCTTQCAHLLRGAHRCPSLLCVPVQLLGPWHAEDPARHLVPAPVAGQDRGAGHHARPRGPHRCHALGRCGHGEGPASMASHTTPGDPLHGPTMGEHRATPHTCAFPRWMQGSWPWLWLWAFLR